MSRTLSALATALISGMIFGIGLAIARMTDPQKIMDFLDLAAIPSGGWDPSLAFVMGGGVLVGLVGLRLDRFMRAPLVAPAFIRRQPTRIDWQLVTGSATFGIGWGLSGFCPGPAIADLGLVPGDIWLLTIAMLVGAWGAGQVMEWSSPIDAADAAARQGT